MKIYVIELWAGEYEDFRTNSIFATDVKENAQLWIDKANRVFEKLHAFYTFKSSLDCVTDEDYDNYFIYSEKQSKFEGDFHIQELELR